MENLKRLRGILNILEINADYHTMDSSYATMGKFGFYGLIKTSNAGSFFFTFDFLFPFDSHTLNDDNLLGEWKC